MGSFNTTCFASNQTIAPGDVCFILPIIQSHTTDTVDITIGDEKFSRYGVANYTCYPDSFWRPFGGFIKAKYDDCGSVELLDTPINRWRLLHFFLRLALNAASIPQGKNRYHDVPFEFTSFLETKAPELTMLIKHLRGEDVADKPSLQSSTLFAEMKAAWAYAADAISEFRLFASERKKYPFQVQLAVTHEVAFNNLIKFLESEKNIKGESFDQRSFFDRNIGAQLLKAKEDEALIREALQGELPTEKREKVEKLLAQVVHDQVYVLDAGLARMGEFNGNVHPSEGFETAPAFSRYSSGVASLDELFEELKPTLNSRYVLAALDVLNIQIQPMVYASQDYSNSIGKEYARFVSATRAIVDKQRNNR